MVHVAALRQAPSGLDRAPARCQRTPTSPFFPSPTISYTLRVTLCSCEAYGLIPMYKEKTDLHRGGSPSTVRRQPHVTSSLPPPPHLSMILDTGQLMGRNTNIRIRLCRCAHARDTQETVRGRAQQEQALAACRMGKLSCSMGGASARCITHRTRSTPTRPRLSGDGVQCTLPGERSAATQARRGRQA